MHLCLISLIRLLKESMECFTNGWRHYDPATTSAVDKLLLEIAKFENLRKDMCETVMPSEVIPLTVEEWNERCDKLDRDFLFDLIMFSEDYKKEWEYLYGAGLTTEVLSESRRKIFNIET